MAGGASHHLADDCPYRSQSVRVPRQTERCLAWTADSIKAGPWDRAGRRQNVASQTPDGPVRRSRRLAIQRLTRLELGSLECATVLEHSTILKDDRYLLLPAQIGLENMC